MGEDKYNEQLTSPRYTQGTGPHDAEYPMTYR